MISYFEENSNRPRRAIQAWIILIHAARNRRIETYKSLSIQMSKHYAGGTLAEVLGAIAFYCIDNNLPPLTTLVVNSETGLPGFNIPVDEDLNMLREKVFNFEDWFQIVPPTEEQFKECLIKHSN